MTRLIVYLVGAALVGALAVIVGAHIVYVRRMNADRKAGRDTTAPKLRGRQAKRSARRNYLRNLAREAPITQDVIDHKNGKGRSR